MLLSSTENSRNFRATRRQIASLLFMAAITVHIGACTLSRNDDPLLRHSFDRKTGANVTSLNRPLVFYRERPRLAANARDYVYAGPIEVSRTGQRNYLIWFGIWSTIDHHGSSTESVRDGFETVYLVADGEPMKLGISAWSGRELGMADAIYETPVDTGTDAFYAVTRDQIRKLAEAENILIFSDAEMLQGAEYLPRPDRTGYFAEFARYLSGN